MIGESGDEFVAECLWPDVNEGDLHALDERVSAVVGASAARGGSVRYLGSLLLREDEIVLCRFVGERTEIRNVADAARVPYERILATGRSPWTTGIPAVRDHT